MSSGVSSSTATAVYGLSTEGYHIASSIALKGSKVSLIDESARMAIRLKPDIARTYPNVRSLIEDEPLLALEPIDIAISDASYVFFAPRIRKVGQDVKSDVTSKFRDAIGALKKGTSVIYSLPTGIGGNNENIALIEHMTGLSVGKDIFYYYMPINGSDTSSSTSEILVGSFKSKPDAQMSKMLYEQDVIHKLNFVDMVSAEFVYSIKILRHYTSMASVLEICKHVQGNEMSSRLIHDTFRDIYIDNIANGLYDLRAIGSSLGGAGPLMYLVNGTIKSIEGYIKHIIDEIRSMLKKRDLKASRTKVAIAWTLDPNEMRGDKIELLSLLETKLKDYIGDVEPQQAANFNLYPTDKTMIVIACTKNDSMRILSKNKQTMDFILMKANPICETIG
ncbi:MAG: hypothetical protein ACJ705_07405 [Nitrososphaeraceae archaeon]